MGILQAFHSSFSEIRIVCKEAVVYFTYIIASDRGNKSI